MLKHLFTSGLPPESADQFQRYSMARLRPIATAVMALTIGVFLMFTAARAMVCLSIAPFASGLAFAVALGCLTWFAARTNSATRFGAAGIVYIAVLQGGALINTLHVSSPLLWLMPTALIVPMCAAPFWLKHTHFAGGTLMSYLIMVPYTMRLPMTREESIVTIMWFAIGMSSAATFHGLFHANRLQHFVLEGRLADLAATDPLTGVPNRRGFLERAQAVLRDCERDGKTASAVFIDIDHFKAINDGFGHAAGDEVLKSVARTLVSEARPADLVGRLGGEEFAVLITTSPFHTAIDIAERLRAAVCEVHRPDGRVTASLGVAEHVQGESLGQLLDRADRAMYHAKRLGRNRVVIAGRDASALPISNKHSHPGLAV